jgi:hypothetical protein
VSKRDFLPIIFIELYLITTLAIFVAGPVSFYVEDVILFWTYIILFHIAMITGYMFGLVCRGNYLVDASYTPNYNKYLFWIVLFGAFIASLMAHKNLSVSESIVPHNIFSDVYSGLESSADQYVKKRSKGHDSGFQGNKLTNILYFFIAPFKIIIVPLLVFYWNKINILGKIVGVSISFMPVLSGISTGTNKPIFDFVVYFGSSLVVYFAACKYWYGEYRFFQRKFFVVCITFGVVGFVVFFGSAMEGRGGDVSFIERTSPLGHIKILNQTNLDFLSYTYIWLSNYLVQGYYGFSLSIQQEFTSTYGFGHSAFTMRQFEWVTGYNLMSSTYQQKIDMWWGSRSNWHSFYSYIANDIHFIGVIFFNFILGLFFAKVWMGILYRKSLAAYLLVPLIALLVIFIPANNQVFGFLETFSTFFVLFFYWIKQDFFTKLR